MTWDERIAEVLIWLVATLLFACALTIALAWVALLLFAAFWPLWLALAALKYLWGW